MDTVVPDGSPLGKDPASSAASATGPLPFDVTKAHHARVYDFLLGGKDNFAADRAVAEQTIAIFPDIAATARANRAFLGRAVRFLAAEAGIRQFLDIGTGIPAAGNTHEVAQAVAPQARVVYVDYDPVVLAHARALLDSSEQGATEYIEADLRDTSVILAGARRLLDFSEPVAVTLINMLHGLPDADDPHAIVGTLMAAVPAGSYLAISHAASDLLSPEAMQALYDSWKGKVQQQSRWRNREETARFFAGLDLVDPGLVQVDDWRPDPGTSAKPGSSLWAGVGRKR